MMELKLKKLQRGFTLVEMAIVLVIFGLLLTAFILPLQAQRELAFQSETENTLENARKAILGFSQANGRLPCPASRNIPTTAFPDGTGSSNPIAGGFCVWQSGFLPGATLGIQPTDAQGYVLDAWGNRIRYAVTQSNVNLVTGIATPNNTFTSDNAMSNAGIANLNPFASLRVCVSASAFNTTCSAPPIAGEANVLTNNAVAVIYSTGATGGQGAAGADETENLDPVAPAAGARVDTVFVSHDQVTAGANAFDHIVIWISPFTLYNAMIQAGQLH